MPDSVQIIVMGVLLGGCTGFIMHRSDFCVAGMLRDIFLFGSFRKPAALLVLITASMVIFETARQLEFIATYPFPLFGKPSLANFVGGALFGVGMVLSGGCVVGVLYRAGSGSVLALTALCGLIAGSALYAELYPWWRKIIAATTLTGHITIPQLLRVDPFLPVAAAAVIALALLGWYHLRAGLVRPARADGALQPPSAALLLSLTGLASVLLTGMPLGITTAYAKLSAYLEALLWRSHYDKLEFFRTIPLNTTQPLTALPLVGGPGATADGIALVQFPLITGIILGSCCSTLLLNEFRIHLRIPTRQYISAAAGGIIMGLASRMGQGCNIWHIFGGLPILALQSILFTAGLIPGAWLGSRLLTRFVIR